MLDHSSNSHFELPADPLSEMLRGLRLDGVEYGRCRLAEPWATAFPAQDAARFHFIQSGCAVLQLAGHDEWLELKAGDAVLLPRGDAHVLASRSDVSPVPFERYGRTKICSGVYDVQCQEMLRGSTQVFNGSMRFNVDRLHPLLQMMPDVMTTIDLARSEPTIPHLLDAMAREVDMDRVGAGGILARLADVLMATMIRTWVEHGCGKTNGWIAAVRSPDVGRVLAAIHLEPERDWTVAELARHMGASRSGFAERFAKVVGETPARYVARVRMHQARLWLKEGMRVAVIAERLGYDAEASFSRAFKRIIGAPPSHFRAKVDEVTPVMELMAAE
ncbi:AraC family transcriptional regulator [Neorhizobium sp. JUb45]|uniref:AraC family transcriptional regulator n=1 Tax=unclassified Neorhizobium TaxID=2629175 RepID=UPI001045F287|nr:AraC family transcriptional regulator [Neorhizobium sp. JUb45]TCR04764.1 AraC family transcriptional regulator [Neorhizobium sp. JUb45]